MQRHLESDFRRFRFLSSWWRGAALAPYYNPDRGQFPNDPFSNIDKTFLAARLPIKSIAKLLPFSDAKHNPSRIRQSVDPLLMYIVCRYNRIKWPGKVTPCVVSDLVVNKPLENHKPHHWCTETSSSNGVVIVRIHMPTILDEIFLLPLVGISFIWIRNDVKLDIGKFSPMKSCIEFW